MWRLLRVVMLLLPMLGARQSPAMRRTMRGLRLARIASRLFR